MNRYVLVQPSTAREDDGEEDDGADDEGLTTYRSSRSHVPHSSVASRRATRMAYHALWIVEVLPEVFHGLAGQGIET